MNQRSSHHSVSTYKDKYILKFGGFSMPVSANHTVKGNKTSYLSFPEVYSLEREEWSTISLREDNKLIMELGIRPIIFKN